MDRKRRRVRPDSVLQGTGCVVMGATIMIALYTLFGSTASSLDGAARVLFVCCACLAPCCLCCGTLMLWHGCGGGSGLFAGASSRFRCDLVAADDDLEGARRE